VQYNIVLLLQSVLLFPSGDARKSLFYGKQRCLETRAATQNIRALSVVRRRVSRRRVEKRRVASEMYTAVDEPLRGVEWWVGGSRGNDIGGGGGGG